MLDVHILIAFGVALGLLWLAGLVCFVAIIPDRIKNRIKDVAKRWTKSIYLVVGNSLFAITCWPILLWRFFGYEKNGGILMKTIVSTERDYVVYRYWQPDSYANVPIILVAAAWWLGLLTLAAYGIVFFVPADSPEQFFAVIMLVGAIFIAGVCIAGFSGRWAKWEPVELN